MLSGVRPDERQGLVESRRRKLAKGTALVAALALTMPGAALARGGGAGGGGGGGGGGGVPVDPALDPPCATLSALNSGQLDQIASRKRITLDFSISNCAQHDETLQTTLVGTGFSWLSDDPFVSDSCTTAPFVGNTITLKPRETRTFQVAGFPTCQLIYGITGRQWTYDATTVDTASGAAVATALTVLRQRTGI
jgi:hypothetical protein